MADKASQSYTIERLKGDADAITDRLLAGVSDGSNFPQHLIPLILQIPDIESYDPAWFWQADLDDQLADSPQDLEENDIEAIHALISDYIRNVQTMDEAENAAKFYLHSHHGKDLGLDDNETALSHLTVTTLQSQLSFMTHPGNSGIEDNGYPILGMNTQPFSPTNTEAEDPLNPAFIRALSSAIETIQTDMRRAETFGPLSGTPLDEMENVGLDRAGMMGEESTKFFNLYNTYLQENPSFGKNDVRERASQFKIMMGILDDLPPSTKNEINLALETLSREPPGLGIPANPDDSNTPQQQPQPSPEQLATDDLMRRVGKMMDIPQSVIDSISSPSVLEAIPSAYINEGFQREMKALFEEDAIQIYGIQAPNSDNPVNRIRQSDDDLFRSWFDADNTPYEFARQEDGTDKLMMVAPDGSLHDIPDGEFPRALFEYHVQPDGSIKKHLMGENGQLLDRYLDGRPVILEGEYPNFDIYHMNFVTNRFLQKHQDASWNEARQEAELDQFFEAKPDAAQLETQLIKTQTSYKQAVLDYFRGSDTPDSPASSRQNEVSDELAIEKLTEAIRQYHSATNQPLGIDEIDDTVQRTLSGKIDQNTFQNILNAHTQAEPRAAAELNTFLAQIVAMRDHLELTNLTDLSNLQTSGLLPGGIQIRPMALSEPWRQNWSDRIDNGQFRWTAANDHRTFDAIVYDAIVESRRTGNNINVSVFEGDDFAMDYLEKQGWNSEAGITVTQAAIIARAAMVKEAVDRHNAQSPDTPITDLNSDQARAAFVNDFRNGEYNWNDIEIFMESFDADEAAKAEHRARFLAVTHEGMHDDYAKNPDFWYKPDDTRRRAKQFNEYFGQDSTLETPMGATIGVENATISQDDAVTLFWRDYSRRSKFDYESARYDIDYDKMMDLLMLQDPSGDKAEHFAREIADIMETGSLYQQFMLKDSNNPSGDMETLYIRRYQAAMEARNETAFKQEHDIIEPEPASLVPEAAPDPDLDKITPAPTKTEEPAAEQQTNNNANPTPEELRAMCDELTKPSAAITELCANQNRALTPAQIPGMTN